MCWVLQWFTECHHLVLRELSEMDMYKHPCECKVVVNERRVQRMDTSCPICELHQEGRITLDERDERIASMKTLIMTRGPNLREVEVGP
ncbi:hypothetical protein Dda_2818 [Drechslerella dactyloides]|uniref:Uncharacterized protein n=1 Tax=Drechslerella dactyloides TaxID=74499 RepID=A0AAD6NJR1_DREDA|nr:hypothetical protein Dda_2818 [Drechslerella dactyloides]